MSQVVEWMPKTWANGHPFDAPSSVQIGWLPCRCTAEGRGHRSFYCETCGDTIYVPAHDDAARKRGLTLSPRWGLSPGARRCQRE